MAATTFAQSTVRASCSLTRAPKRAVTSGPRMMPAGASARMILPGSGALRSFAVSSPASRRSGRASVVVVRASELSTDLESTGLAGKGDYSPVIALAAFVAMLYNRATLDTHTLLKAISYLQLTVAAVSIIASRWNGDRVASVIGPATLAVAFLQLPHISVLQAATGLFGYYISEQLEGEFWLWLPTLAYALYAGYGTQWYTAAFILHAGTKLTRGLQNNHLSILTVPFIGVGAWALYARHTHHFALALFLGQIIWSGFQALTGLADQVSNE